MVYKKTKMNKYRLALLALILMGNSTIWADQVILDDLIATQSSCVGTGCSDGEMFGETTLKLKGDILQIEFRDTSSSASFPTNDWKIIVNDPDGAGTESYFAIQDVDGGGQLFRIDAGAPSESLVVDNQGNLSLSSKGTSRINNVAAPTDLTDGVSLGYLKNLPIAKATIPWISISGTGKALTSGSGSTALGERSSARSYDTAIGYQATVTADNSTAIGANTTIHSVNSVAVGANAIVEQSAVGGTAIGQNSRVQSGASNSVAIGSNSIADENNTVSVGTPDNMRKITNVADGVNKTDAVNKRQLGKVSNRVSQNRSKIIRNNSEIANNRLAIQDNRESINQLTGELEDTFAGIAAIASLIPMTPSAPGKTTLNIGAANFEGESAIGISFAHRLQSMLFNDTLFLNCGISFAGNELLGSLGAGWSF